MRFLFSLTKLHLTHLKVDFFFLQRDCFHHLLEKILWFNSTNGTWFDFIYLYILCLYGFCTCFAFRQKHTCGCVAMLDLVTFTSVCTFDGFVT